MTQNDEAERLIGELRADAEMHEDLLPDRAADMIRTQAARIAELEGWKTVAESNQQIAQSWQARAEAAEAEVAEAKARGYARGLEDAAEKAKDHLIDWASDLAETRDELISAQASGFFNGRKVRDNGWLKAQARRFNERAEAVAESADHTSAAIRALAKKEAEAVKGGTISTGPHCDCGMIGPCMFKKCRHPLAANNGEAASDFPPPHCTAWEDCNHDGICHDPKCCGATGPNHEAFYGEAGE